MPVYYNNANIGRCLNEKKFVLVLIGLLLSSGITGCSEGKNSNTNPNPVNLNQINVNPNQENETRIRNIAVQWLNNRESKVKNWESAKVIATKYTDDHNVYKGNESINIKGIDTYKVVFEIEDDVWGGTAISIYVDKESENVLGADLIPR